MNWAQLLEPWGARWWNWGQRARGFLRSQGGRGRVCRLKAPTQGPGQVTRWGSVEFGLSCQVPGDHCRAPIAQPAFLETSWQRATNLRGSPVSILSIQHPEKGLGVWDHS